MRWAGARRAAAVLVALALGGACRGAGPRVPAGVTLVPEAPPPPAPLVEEAQRRLQRRGWYVGPIDGDLSPATRVALAKLQRERDLEPTGRLDEATLDALGLGAPPRPVRPEAAAPEGATRRPGSTPPPPLRAPAPPDRPQPAPGALAEAREEARRLLAEGAAAAAPLPGPGDLGDLLAPPAERMGEAGEALASARALAFERLLRARDDGGWALLPRGLIERLEEALATRSLLVHGPDGRLGEDDAAAIRWVERSVGLPSTGEPNLRLLEALGIDPSPMFEP